MAEEATTGSDVTVAYQRANAINARLSSGYDAGLVQEGRALAKTLLEHVKSQVEDYEDFAKRVERSELFSLHESAQIGKKEKALRAPYLRAVDLLETIEDVEKRHRRAR